MLKTTIFDTNNKPKQSEKREVIDFLFDNLEQYGESAKRVKLLC